MKNIRYYIKVASEKQVKNFWKKYLLLRSKQSIINKVAKVTETDCSLKTKQNETLSKS